MYNNRVEVKRYIYIIFVVVDFELFVFFFGFDIYGFCWNIKIILSKYFILIFKKSKLNKLFLLFICSLWMLVLKKKNNNKKIIIIK